MKRVGVGSFSGCDQKTPIRMRGGRAVAMVLGAVSIILLHLDADGRTGSVAAVGSERASVVTFSGETLEESPGAQPRASKDADQRTERYPLQLGDTRVDVVISERPGSRYLFCNLHDDENTAVEAGLIVLRRLGGRLVELQHGGKRHLTFRLDGKTSVVDPNRIFTTEGVRKTLSKLSRRSAEAERAVERFAKDLLSIYAIGRTGVVIALHNNTEGAYSALSYDKGGVFASDAAAVAIKDGRDPDDFYFVTETVVFEALRRRGFNVVLQDNRRVTDDGSLSVYCGHAGVRYINVEAQQGHVEQQVAMVLALADVLEEIGQAPSR